MWYILRDDPSPTYCDTYRVLNWVALRFPLRFETLDGRRLGFFFINKTWSLGGELHCFWNASPLFRFYCVLCAVMSFSFFIRWRKEREKLENVVVLLVFKNMFIVGCWFLRWTRRAISVLAGLLVWSPIGSERTTNELASSWSARLVSDRIGMGSGWRLCVLVLFAPNLEQGE